ncbi:MAG: hypothetical protein HGA82_01010 [Anaerolineales bacterium]|nr:hypothetical protein [Anaerolineales bacterium]
MLDILPEFIIHKESGAEAGGIFFKFRQCNPAIAFFLFQALFENITEGVTFKIEADEQTGYQEKVIIESRVKAKNPSMKIISADGEELKNYDLPVGSHLQIEEGKTATAHSNPVYPSVLFVMVPTAAPPTILIRPSSERIPSRIFPGSCWPPQQPTISGSPPATRSASDTRREPEPDTGSSSPSSS